MKESYLYKKLEKNKVLCRNCAHYCVLSPEEKGICSVKENKKGILYSLNYSLVSALNIDPIEKKPLFHFLPGSYSLSIGSPGCNFQCKNCQNWRISQVSEEIKQEKITAEEIVEIALKNKTPSISYTYTEPAIFSEFSFDVMKKAKKEGLKNVWVTNGFWSKELFNLITPLLDAVNVDLKSFNDNFYKKNCKARLKPVLENLKKLKEKNIWTEITTLIIPKLNDSEKELEEIAKFIKKELGEETPWHLSRFSGSISWKLQNTPETSSEKLELAYKIAKKEGLKNVYLGNIINENKENTFCPSCNFTVIERKNYQIKRFDKKGKCPKCNKKINLYD